jgi:hypothetical protein
MRFPPGARGVALRILAALFGLWLLAAISLGIAWLTHGWTRLDPLPTPDPEVALAPFRPYAEHESVLGGRDFPYVIHIEEAPGAILFFGSRHTRDPDHPQIARIQESWKEFEPTIALCESRLGLYVGGLSAGVRMFGEVGAPYALARRDDVPVFTLEPSWDDEVAAMLADFGREEVAAFYFLRAFVSERGGYSGPAVESLAEGLLGKRVSLPGLEGAFESLPHFDDWWASGPGGTLGDWRTMPEQTMWPTESGQTILNELALASNRARDAHMTRLLIDLARQGERVFVVCGGSHALTIEPALREALRTVDVISH